MRIFVLTGTYELRVSRKSHLRDHPKKTITHIWAHLKNSALKKGKKDTKSLRDHE
jgi:hypothetical protein